MLLPFSELLDFVQRFRRKVLLVAVSADDQRDIFNNQKAIAAAEGLGDPLDLSRSTANGAGYFIHSRVLGSDSFNCAGHLQKYEFVQFNLVAGIVDVDADQSATVVLIKDDTLRNFPAVYAWPFRQVDIERVCFRVIVELHGLKSRSGKALWIVI